MKQIVLASKSPRRKELLEKCGVSFLIDAADIDETIDPTNSLEVEIGKLAYRKAEAVLKRHPDAFVIGSDTIVVLNNEVLGKPKNAQHAKKMLASLSDQTHQVITGVCFLSNEKKDIAVSVSHVTFTKLSDEEIDAYVASGEADDKAGAYGIQGKAGCFITRIDGDYYSIMGFPISIVYQKLKEEGYLAI